MLVILTAGHENWKSVPHAMEYTDVPKASFTVTSRRSTLGQHCFSTIPLGHCCCDSCKVAEQQCSNNDTAPSCTVAQQCISVYVTLWSDDNAAQLCSSNGTTVSHCCAKTTLVTQAVYLTGKTRRTGPHTDKRYGVKGTCKARRLTGL
jgi:hypothetical protein